MIGVKILAEHLLSDDFVTQVVVAKAPSDPAGLYHGERFNAITHLVGAVLALVGLIVLVVEAALHGGALRVVSASVYGASLVVLYTSSTLYHSFSGTAKRVFQRIDHLAIYLLIAGTYTPFSLVILGGLSAGRCSRRSGRWP